MRWSDYVVAPVLMDGPRRRLPARRPRRRRRRCARSSARRCGASPRASARSTSARSCAGACVSSARSCGASRAGPTRARAELSDGAIDLARDRQLADGEEAGRPPAARSALHDLLTPREVDVLEHLVKRRDQRRDRPHAGRLRGHGQVPRQEHPAQDERRPTAPRRPRTTCGSRCGMRPEPTSLSLRTGAYLSPERRRGAGTARECRMSVLQDGSGRWPPGSELAPAYRRVEELIEGRALRDPRRRDRHRARAPAARRRARPRRGAVGHVGARPQRPTSCATCTAATSSSAATSSRPTPGA